MLTMHQEVREEPGLPSPECCKLRVDLLEEELTELKWAIVQKDIVGIADALTDLKYVLLGAECAFGLDGEPCFNEVHRSNMTKVGGEIREDGKLLKPASYEPPNFWWLKAPGIRLNPLDFVETKDDRGQYIGLTKPRK